MSDFSLYLQATTKAYSAAAKDAAHMLFKNWIILVGSLAAFFAFLLIAPLVAPLGIAGGFLLGLFQLVFLTLYYHWIASSVRRTKLRWSDLIEFEPPLFFTILSVAFLIFVVEFILQSLTRGLHLEWVVACAQLAIFFAFNALPEVIMIRRIESLSAFASAWEFIRDNLIEWYIPLLVLLSPLLLLSMQPELLLLVLGQSEPLLPVLAVVQSYQFLSVGSLSLVSLLGLLVGTWFMLFRGFLFLELESSSRRQRAFQARQM